MIFVILYFYIIYSLNSTLCVNLNSCKIKNLCFIASKSYHIDKISSKNDKHLNTSIKTSSFPEVSHLNKDRNYLDYIDNVPKFKDESFKKIFEIDKKGSLNLKDPIKAVTASLIPDILKVYQNRMKLGYGQVPTLLCCSGGVDSMSLLHCMGLIKQNYEHLLNNEYIPSFTSNIFQFNTSNNTEKVSRDEKKLQISDIKNDILKMFKDFYDDFYVVYFNHKQRDDVDRDIEAINEACKQYGFNFIVKEIPFTEEMIKEGKRIGLQNLFRLWRRETCIKIIDELTSNSKIFKANNSSNEYNNNNTNTNTEENKLDLNIIFDGELESIRRVQDLTGLKGLVFMAHHLDDNFETVLLKLLRGTFLSNMTPMELYDGLDKNGYLLIRPFIDLKKSDLESFMEGINGVFNEDCTNKKLCYSRNVLRNLMIPQIADSLSNNDFRDNYHNSNQDNTSNNKEEMKTTNNIQPRELLLGLDKRFKYMSKQCNNYSDLIVNEVDMFFDYINWKYNSNKDNSNNIVENKCNQESWRGLGDEEKNELKKVYRNFYESLYNNKYKGLNNFEVQFNNVYNHLKKIGLKMDGFFYLKEWSIIPNKLIKEQTINRFIFEKLGKYILYKTLYGLVKILSKNLFTNQIKMYSVGNYLIYHQGYMLKIRNNKQNIQKKNINKSNNNKEDNRDKDKRNEGDDNKLDERKLIYSDDKVNIYNLLDNLKVEVNKNDLNKDNFYLKFSLTPLINYELNNNNTNTSNNINTNNKDDEMLERNLKEVASNTSPNNKENGKFPEKLEIEIRYLNQNDIVPFKRMWANNAFKILTNIGIHKILKDEVPGIVIAGTNQVIGFYGFNCTPPYYPKGNQSLSYQTNIVNEPVKYNIRIS